MPILLELPIPVVQGTDLSGLQPSRDTMEVEGMIAHTPSNSAFLACCTGLVCLALDTQIHDVIPADSTVVDNYVPGPQGHGIPFFNFKSFLILVYSRRTCRYFVVTINIHNKLAGRLNLLCFLVGLLCLSILGCSLFGPGGWL